MANEKANELFEKAQSLNDAGEYGEALSYYLFAAREGHAEALYQAAYYYYAGLGTEEDVDAALTLSEKARSLGSQKASGMVAVIHIERDSEALSNETLIALLKEGFDAGCYLTCFYLSQVHWAGFLDGEPNAMLAAYYAIRGLENDWRFNYYVLGDLYYNGRYLPKNYAYAKYCHEALCEASDAFDIGTYENNAQYRKVKPMKPEFPTFDDDAPDFFTRPCPACLHEGALLRLYDKTRQSDPAEGRSMMEEAMRYGNTDSFPSYAARLLGEPFSGEFSIDSDGYVSFQPDPARALALYEKGASLGDPFCYHSLGIWYASGGDGVEKDTKKAIGYLEMAVRMSQDEDAVALLQELKDEVRSVSATCPVCYRKWSIRLTESEYAHYEIALEEDDIPDGIGALTLFEKEFFISGMCPECQARVFKKECPSLTGRWLVEE